MTTNETSFFRDAHPFEVLRKMVLPDLIQRRAAERRLHIWCAACSSGQEPYTIAMLLREYFPELNDWPPRILASDRSTEMVERARGGRYNQTEVSRGLPARLLVKYFDKTAGGWQIKSEVRSLVEFRCLNLIKPWPALPAMDVVFLRNVLIYFSVESKKQILARVRRVLRPDGFLFLGGTETTFNIDNSFERVNFNKGGCYRLR